MIDLRRLHVLRAVAHCGTVTAAAEAVHLTPSAASQQIRQLGRELGVALLEPHGRRVRLTPAARSLLAHADAIEERWRQAEADLRATSTDAPAGALRLCGFPTAVCTLLSVTAVRLRKTWPALSVHVQEAEPGDCFDLLFAGDADVAVVEATRDSPPLTDARFDQQLLLDDPFDLLVFAEHRLACEPVVSLPELACESWIVGMPGTSYREHVLAACAQAGFAPTIVHQAHEWSVVGTLVASDLGIGLVPRRAQLPPHPDIARIPLTGPAAPVRRFRTAIVRGTRDHPAINAALTTLHEIADEPAQELDHQR
ncbi:LysR family transcriptional regulator [Saccharopolyspora sp. K220]|uniref:LysR family transcriptional regulator n=1 Tax=Saccharopolyspora soli TaxID=2926618 RepID=UPI001F59C2C5|nr:LysR family transcriptional regulator [Saccharopolyspora soli]MCI2419104.1 LysR family transcriptional regulator [Saccharopolyspora soli]